MTFTRAFLMHSQIPLSHCLLQSKILPHQHSTYIFLSRKLCSLLIKCQLHSCHHDMKNFRFNGIRVLSFFGMSFFGVYIFFLFHFRVLGTEYRKFLDQKNSGCKTKQNNNKNTETKGTDFQELPPHSFASHFLSFLLTFNLQTSNKNTCKQHFSKHFK